MRMRSILFGILGLALATIAACTSVPLSSLPKLAAMDTPDFRASGVEIAVRVQDAFRVERDGVQLTLSLANKEAGVDRKEVFLLSPSTGVPTPVLRKAAKSGFEIVRFRVDPADAARLDNLLDQAKALRAAKTGKSSFGMAAGAKFCRAPGASASKAARMTLFLRANPRDDFFVLVRETRLDFEGAGGKGAGGQEMKPCTT